MSPFAVGSAFEECGSTQRAQRGDQVITEEERRSAIRRLLDERRAGREDTLDELLPLIMEEMRLQARIQRQKLARFTDMATTVIVHDTYMKLRNAKAMEDDRHLSALIATAMKQVVIDQLRKRKREGKHKRVPIDEFVDTITRRLHGENEKLGDVLDLTKALDELALIDPTAAQIVELRFFGDYTMGQVAKILDMSLRSVERLWKFARSWLREKLE